MHDYKLPGHLRLSTANVLLFQNQHFPVRKGKDVLVIFHAAVDIQKYKKSHLHQLGSQLYCCPVKKAKPGRPVPTTPKAVRLGG